MSSGEPVEDGCVWCKNDPGEEPVELSTGEVMCRACLSDAREYKRDNQVYLAISKDHYDLDRTQLTRLHDAVSEVVNDLHEEWGLPDMHLTTYDHDDGKRSIVAEDLREGEEPDAEEAVVRALCSSGGSITLGGIASRAGVSRVEAERALGSLVDKGLVDSRSLGEGGGAVDLYDPTDRLNDLGARGEFDIEPEHPHASVDPDYDYVLNMVESDDYDVGDLVCTNLVYPCGHAAYGPQTLLPEDCPECGGEGDD